MISAITYLITQTISSYITHVYSMDINYKLHAWIICITLLYFNKIIVKTVCLATSLFLKII